MNLRPSKFTDTEKLVRSLIAACRSEFESLPTPVRYRAAGAGRAWRDVQNSIGLDGKAFTQALADPSTGPVRCLEMAFEALKYHVNRDWLLSVVHRDVGGLSVLLTGVIWQAFWARDGALYEPTVALDELLDASDITNDMPLSALKLPSHALCIVPSAQARKNLRFSSVGVFSHNSELTEARSVGARGLTLVFSGNYSGELDKRLVFEIYENCPHTLNETIMRSTAGAGSDPREILAANGVLMEDVDYVFKVLLYLSLDRIPLRHDPAFSHAPKIFPGLGRRKRELLTAEVDKLYDKYVIGPASYSAPEGGPLTGENGSTVSPHWRRGHFRWQAHGPRASLRKVMFIMPTLVRGKDLTFALSDDVAGR